MELILLITLCVCVCVCVSVCLKLSKENIAPQTVVSSFVHACICMLIKMPECEGHPPVFYSSLCIRGGVLICMLFSVSEG